MRLSRASAYALGAVLQLADAPPGVPIPCSQLARQGQMPERFLLQVLRNLVTQGILTSTRGVDGGYALTRSLEEISLLKILEATDGPQVAIVPPLDALPEVSRSRLQAVLEKVAAATAGRMEEVKVSALYVKRPELQSGEIAGNK